MTREHVYDVVVIGSGAGGGTLSARLALLGADVLVLEGGPKVDTRTDFNTHAVPYEFPFRSIPVMKPGKPGFDSERSRGLGGKTMLWNAVALRFSQRDFKGRRYNGAGEDRPSDYQDLAPYYERMDASDERQGRYVRSVQFFSLVKNLTADGYYTSQIGLVQELGYKHEIMAEYPSCSK